MSKKLTSSCNDALQANQNQIILYQPSETISLEVRLENDTVWLTQEQIAVLFGVKRPAITKHIRNIFETLELEEDSVCSILERTASENKLSNIKNRPLITYFPYLFLNALMRWWKFWRRCSL